MPEEGTKRVAVIDSESGKPVAGVPLVYHYIEKPYWIVGKVSESEPYVSDEYGIALVPKHKTMLVAADCEWTSWIREHIPDSSNDQKVYLVTKKEVDPGADINSESLRASP